MIALELDPRTKTELPNSRLNWALAPDFQNEPALKCDPSTRQYTFEELTGNLAEELWITLESTEIEPALIPDVKPEDFEEIYRWFLS